MRSIGEKVAKLRAERGWTLKQLSEYSGVSLSHIHAIENHTRPNPSFQYVARLAKAFGVPINYFAEDTPIEPLPVSAGADPLGDRIQQLYDADTIRFIASERSKPYLALAMRLAREDVSADPSHLLNAIAQFMRDSQPGYESR